MVSAGVLERQDLEATKVADKTSMRYAKKKKERKEEIKKKIRKKRTLGPPEAGNNLIQLLTFSSVKPVR